MADRSTQSVIALAALTILAAVALRGTVPGASREPREPAPDNPASMIVVLVLLFAAVAVVVLAVVLRSRQPTAAAATVGGRPQWLRGDAGRPTWRGALIAFLVVGVWLALSIWLSRLGGGTALDPPGFVPGTTADPAAPPPPANAPQPPAPGLNPLGYFTAATVAFLLAVVVGTLVAMRRRPKPVPTEPREYVGPEAEIGDGSRTLARAAEVGLAEVADPNRDPRAAIIACYVAMEGELARVPEAAPQDFDTASEVLARAVAQHALRPGTATRLVDLFDEARFSPHVMDEGHRSTAAAALGEVLAEIRSRT